MTSDMNRSILFMLGILACSSSTRISIDPNKEHRSTIFEDVYFEPNSTTISDTQLLSSGILRISADSLLFRLTSWFSKNPEVKVCLLGGCDPSEDPAIAGQRALFLREQILNGGVTGERVEICQFPSTPRLFPESLTSKMSEEEIVLLRRKNMRVGIIVM